jgi:hypothetical protein
MGTGTAATKNLLEPLMAKPLSEIVANPKNLPLLRFDLSVTAEPKQSGGYDKIKFTVGSRPGLFELLMPPRRVKVNVIAIPETGLVWHDTIPISSKGETKEITAQITGIDVSKLHGDVDKGQTITVLVDPFDIIPESTEGNNIARAYCYQIG